MIAKTNDLGQVYYTHFYSKVVILTMKGLDTVESLSVEASGFTKTRAFPAKSGLVL